MRVLLLLALAIASFGAVFAIRPPHYVENDDFCDDLRQGVDERNSSACSFIPNLNEMFKCHSDEENKDTIGIPMSRVGDGICDCCDGSDEAAFFPKLCHDTCEA